MAIFLLCIQLILCACTVENEPINPEENERSENMNLTDRQIEILCQLGISTEVDELTDNQKEGIVAIEEMLTYLEDKYNENFEYLGYVQGSNLEGESLTAKKVGGTFVDVVTVIRKNGTFEDDYAKVLARADYEKYIRNYFGEKGDSVKVYSDISEVAEDYESYLSENPFKVISSSDCIFLDASTFDEEAFEKIISEYSELLKTNLDGNSNCTVFYLYDTSVFSDLNRFNYKSRVIEHDSIIHKAISISVRGEVNIF